MKRSPYILIDYIFPFLGSPKTLSFLMVLAIFTFTGGILAQAKNQPAPAKSEPAKSEAPKKDAESKPLKLESGTVTVDPQIVSSKIKQTNIKHLKKLKSSFINNGEEQKFNDIMKGYVEATITLGEKNYLEARRKFEQNQSDMNEGAKSLTDKYKEVYSKLYSDYSFQVVEMKINGTTDLSNSSYEKMLSTGNELKNNAEDLVARGNFIEAVYSMKSAINQLIKIPYFINKNKNKNIKINDRLEQNLIIDEDYIPKEVLKDYDDSIYLIHEERQKERDKERDAVRKSIETRLGLASTSSSDESKDSKDSKPEAVKPTTSTAPNSTKAPEKK